MFALIKGDISFLDPHPIVLSHNCLVVLISEVLYLRDYQCTDLFLEIIDVLLGGVFEISTADKDVVMPAQDIIRHLTLFRYFTGGLEDGNGRKEHPCHTKLCAFRCLNSIPQNQIPWSRTSEK